VHCIKLRSKDSTQVGALLVSSNKEIISTGYNGPLPGMDDTTIPWKKRRNEEPSLKHLVRWVIEKVLYSRITQDQSFSKHDCIIHAEDNCLTNFLTRSYSAFIENATLFVSHFPCWNCALKIIQTKSKRKGITHIVYNQYPRAFPKSIEATKALFYNNNVIYTKYEEDSRVFSFEDCKQRVVVSSKRTITYK
jgi:dCMP deaminase